MTVGFVYIQFIYIVYLNIIYNCDLFNVNIMTLMHLFYVECVFNFCINIYFDVFQTSTCPDIIMKKEKGWKKSTIVWHKHKLLFLRHNIF